MGNRTRRVLGVRQPHRGPRDGRIGRRARAGSICGALLVIGALSTVVGCAGASSSATTRQSQRLASAPLPNAQSQDVISRLAAAGLACSDVQYGVTGTYFGGTPADQATCAVGGNPIFIAGYSTKPGALDGISAARGLACAYAQQLAGDAASYLFVVNDRTRDVAVADRADMETVARALGGTPIVIGC